MKKSDYNTKINEIEIEITTDHDHAKYITTQEFNKLTLENITTRLKQAIQAIKSDITNLVKKNKTNLNKNKLNDLSKKI